MTIKTQLYSVDTLHVQVPKEIDSESFNEQVGLYSEGNEYNGVDDADGGLMIEAKDLKFNIAGYDNESLAAFFDEVRKTLGDADQIYFHR